MNEARNAQGLRAFDALPSELGPAELKSCCATLYELPITRLLLGPSFHPGGPALTRRLGELALIARDSRVLDVACGAGESARVLALARGCSVTGVDLSAPNIARATRLSAGAGLAERCSFLQGDAEQLPETLGGFDVVICECALCTFPDMGRALSEMGRVLLPGGRLALSDVIVNRALPEELGGVLGHVLCLAGARDRSGYESALANAGFAAIRFRDASHTLIELVAAMEGRLARARVLQQAGVLEIPSGLEDAEPLFERARSFIREGGAGYGLWTARWSS